ncbi:hypothetical protein A2797_01485 [candidate division WWE3 bacterium RIFCSPHIGHO2_01_FULL_48_15]|uniref:TrbL/VirB6 plasmid conjugal transfer protein n=1 Tax=candidate division WWE3 bacterium RIFCSPHIGHO2_01_FULL_48_15 TaxID=1802619 RepID=A0A1F4VDG5_UNCKA|nr:MAG: hypothetical protein A2797_01485 [candidate division WWE3 bacterium RIFCSPHIGHO2_01_FULL_48_15]
MNWRPKPILLGLFAFSLFLVFAAVALARETTGDDYGATFGNLWSDVAETSCETTDLNCLTINTATSMENFLFTQIVGVEYDNVTKGVTAAMIDGEWDRGLAAATGRLLGSVYANPPSVHLAGYFQEKLSNNILNSPAQATVGTDFLNSILNFWERMRDLAYGLFLIIMVSIGLMIILRREIAPRVVISFTNALPKIVIGLALITFSFPLIGLAVDVGLVFGSELVKNTLVPPGINLEKAGEAKSAADASSQFTTKAIGVTLDGLAGDIFGAFVGLIAGVIFGAAFVLISILAILRLLLSYAKILLATIFSPLVILIGTLPGQEGVLSSLTKNILVNVLTFPAVLFFLLLGSFFLQTQGGINVFPDNSGAAGLVAQSSKLFSPQIAASILALISALFAWKAPSMIEAAFEVGGKPRGKK